MGMGKAFFLFPSALSLLLACEADQGTDKYTLMKTQQGDTGFARLHQTWNARF